MNIIGHFLLYNLLPSIAVGIISWVVVTFALRILPIDDAKLRLAFFGVPVIKSALILLGIGFVLPWPHAYFGVVHAKALSPQQLLPGVLAWVFFLWLTYFFIVKRTRSKLLQSAYMTSGLGPRLAESLKRVRQTYHQRPLPLSDIGFCSITHKAPTPALLLSNQLRSPSALIAAGQPIILLPERLVIGLSDDELDGIIAHELGHFVLRRNRWCSPSLLRRLVVISPAALLVLAQLNREEELVCDDIAIGVIGQPELYAETLIKSYRFARTQPRLGHRFLRPLPQFLGYKTGLSERVERLVQLPPKAQNSRYQYLLACSLWFGLIVLFFSG